MGFCFQSDSSWPDRVNPKNTIRNVIISEKHIIVTTKSETHFSSLGISWVRGCKGPDKLDSATCQMECRWCVVWRGEEVNAKRENVFANGIAFIDFCITAYSSWYSKIINQWMHNKSSIMKYQSAKRIKLGKGCDILRISIEQSLIKSWSECEHAWCLSKVRSFSILIILCNKWNEAHKKATTNNNQRWPRLSSLGLSLWASRDLCHLWQ